MAGVRVCLVVWLIGALLVCVVFQLFCWWCGLSLRLMGCWVFVGVGCWVYLVVVVLKVFNLGTGQRAQNWPLKIVILRRFARAMSDGGLRTPHASAVRVCQRTVMIYVTDVLNLAS